MKNRMLNLLFPDDVVCPVCNGEATLGEDGVCDACRAKLVRCGTLSDCPAMLAGLTAGYVYDDAIRNAVHRFKYKGNTWLAPFFAAAIEPPSDWAVDCIVPVPLHPLKHWLRGYNQSELIARALEQRRNDPAPVRLDLIRRKRYTLSQASLSAEKRMHNLDGAFMASTAAKGLSILLVDDVTTTHSTLAACATALCHAGAVRVYGACACAARLDTEAGTDG